MSSDTTHITVTPEVLAQLQIPTPESARKQRQGPGGKMLTYVDARYVMGVLDSELGPGNWQNEFSIGAGGKVGCRIGIFVDDRGWVWKGDGAGETDIEGEKGSFSDAFKRAAVQWGIARDLYGDPGVAASVPQAAPVPQPVERPPLPPNTVPYQDRNAEGGDSCPAGHGAWTVQPGGTTKSGPRQGQAYDPFWKCAGKGPNNSFCKEKPSKAWVDAHPIAA